VYTFDDNKPLFEKKARLIERIIPKKEEKKNFFNDPQPAEEQLDRSRVKNRSIPGGIGHQIVFNSKTEREQIAQKQLQEADMAEKQFHEMVQN
jgi:hypothetical protein